MEQGATGTASDHSDRILQQQPTLEIQQMTYPTKLKCRNHTVKQQINCIPHHRNHRLKPSLHHTVFVDHKQRFQKSTKKSQLGRYFFDDRMAHRRSSKDTANVGVRAPLMMTNHLLVMNRVHEDD